MESTIIDDDEVLHSWEFGTSKRARWWPTELNSGEAGISNSQLVFSKYIVLFAAFLNGIYKIQSTLTLWEGLCCGLCGCLCLCQCCHQGIGRASLLPRASLVLWDQINQELG